MAKEQSSAICNLEGSGGVEEESKGKSRGEQDVLIASPILQKVRVGLVLKRKKCHGRDAGSARSFSPGYPRMCSPFSMPMGTVQPYVTPCYTQTTAIPWTVFFSDSDITLEGN